MHSLLLIGLILLGLIFLWLNYSEYTVVEGARSRYKKSVSIASEIQQIKGNLNNNNKKIKPLNIKGIPIIAIIFPPIGLLMLLKYLLNKNKKEG